MPNKKIILILLGLCCLLFALLFYNQDQLKTQSGQAQELFLPELENQLPTVSKINIDSSEQPIVLENKQERWIVASKDGYPADIASVRQLLYGMVGLKILEAKTSNELLLGEIGLADNDELSVRVRLSDARDTVLADVLFGKSQTSLSGQGQDWFIRQNDSPQSWLVSGEISPYKSAYQWLDKSVLTVPVNEIEKVELQAQSNESFDILSTSQDGQYELADAKENESVEQYKLDQIVNAVASIQLDDVRKKLDSESDADLPGVHVKTTDDLEIHLRITDVEQGWITLKAMTESSDQADIDRVESLNSKWLNWEYKIPEFKIEQLTLKRQNLFSDPENDSSEG